MFLGLIRKDGVPVVDSDLKFINETVLKGESHTFIGNHTGDFAYCTCQRTNSKEQFQEPHSDGRFIVLFHGMLHNRKALYKCLGLSENNFFSDSVLVLQCFLQSGQQCISKLEGEFSFAIWDSETKKLFLAEDHIGFKGLYYYNDQTQLIFSTELKPIQHIKPKPNYFDEELLMQYLFFNGDSSATYNKEIKALGGGNAIVYGDGKFQKYKYWQLEKGKYSFRKDEEWYECLRELFKESVHKRLNTQSKLGIKLSGGLDSGSIASIVASALKEKNLQLHAFTSTPVHANQKNTEDQYYLDILLKRFDNIHLTHVYADDTPLYSGIGECFEMDNTFPSAFYYMDHAILKKVKQDNIDTLFTGYGGDFWVSAPGRYIIYHHFMNFRIRSALKWIAEHARGKQKPFLHLLKTEVLIHLPISRYYFEHFRKPWDLQKLANHQFIKKYNITDINDTIVLMKWLLEEGWIGRKLRMFDNRNAAYGLVTANPFFDKDLMEFMINVPARLFIKDGYRRSLFRNAMEGILPPEIQWRRTKSPYVTDYAERVRDFQPKAMEIIGQSRETPFFQKFFNWDKVKDYGEYANTKGNVHDLHRFSNLVICTLSLAYLKENGYIFL